MSVKFIEMQDAVDDRYSTERWLASESPELPARFLKAIKQQYQFIREFPEAGHPLPKYPYRKSSPKEFPHHVILYSYTDETVLILRVVHQAQDLHCFV